jgi:RNA polymerase sigma-70 factor (ECF subfamily)
LQPTRSAIADVERLYRQHGSALLLFAAAITGDRSRAQDAIHQVFVKLLADGNLQKALDAKAYLFTCVRNAALNDAKVRQRDVTFDESAWFEPPGRDYAAEINLRRALLALPEDQRQVIILHVWGELTFAQITQTLEISPNTVASRYRYALSRLREDMRPKEDFCANQQSPDQ